ncbi:MAG: thioredoxin family protein [Burkholderiaceae bacterium]|nr:thioredoxin family protein [Burkholderiaceae bacterium]
MRPAADAPADPSRRDGLRATLALALAAGGVPAQAALPPGYGAVVLAPTIGPENPPVWEFDLRAAQQQARREGRRLYVYLGASDCSHCRRYEAFLAANEAQLRPHFRERWLMVDLHSRLEIGDRRLRLRSESLRLPYADFQRAIGDERARLLVYPCVWLLDAHSGLPLMQMPAGAGTFSTVAEQLEILRLEQ